MQIASRMAGYSLGEADILRRAMGKKKKEVMAAERQRFIDGAKGQAVKAGEAGKVFDLMEHFAGYGFNKSHSAAYALVAYQTAWLKAHHPVHFMAALLTTEKDNTDKLVKYVNECREMGIPVLPPDVNSSGLDFTVEAGRVRFGLSAIKNVGEGAIRTILTARERRGPFRSLHDLAADADLRLVNKRVLEALVQSGALDSTGGRRSQLAAVVDAAMESGQRRRADREAGQSSLFGGQEVGAPDAEERAMLPDLPDWDERTRLAHEKATLGFYVTGHPLESHRALVAEFASHSSATLRDANAQSEVAIAGIITDLKRRKSKKGDWWASFQLEDLDGLVEVMLFPKGYEAFQHALASDRAVLVTGRVDHEEERARLRADAIHPLEGLLERSADAVQVRLETAELEDDLLARLRGALEAHRGDKHVYLEVVEAGNWRLLARAETGLRVSPSDQLTRDIESVVGAGRVRYRTRR